MLKKILFFPLVLLLFIVLNTATLSAQVFSSFPDSVFLSADTNSVDTLSVMVWNSGTPGDSVVIDSIKFISSYGDTAIPFIAIDSAGNDIPDSIGRVLLDVGSIPEDTLRFQVLFSPSVQGPVYDTLLIVYSFGVDSANYVDTVYVRGDGYLPMTGIYQSAPDTLYLTADTGTVGSNPVQIWNNGVAGDSIVIDTVRFFTTNDTLAAPFSIGDSAGNAFVSDSLGIILESGDMLQLSGKILPSVQGMFEDSLIIVYSFGKDSANYLDTIVVNGTGTLPVTGDVYQSVPDTLFLMADTGTVNSNSVQIWNNGVAGDSIVIDTLRFVTTNDTLAAPFSIGDSAGNAFAADSLGIILETGEMLQLSGNFFPSVQGMFEDSLIIVYSFGKDSANYLDTIVVNGMGTLPVTGDVYQSAPDTLFLAADSGAVDSNYVQIWNMGAAGDTVIIDTVKFLSSLDTLAAPFSVGDSLGFPFMVDSLGRLLLPQPGDTLQLSVFFRPTAPGMFEDTLLITYSLGTDSGNHIDSIRIRGDSYIPAGQLYQSAPDTLYLMADTGMVGVNPVHIWNNGGGGDSIVVDTLRFVSTNDTLAAPFSISDSAGNAFASDSVGFVILPGGMLQLSGKFAPSVAGMFEDSLIIVYSFGKDSVNYTDTVHVSGMGTIPAGLEYASAPDTLFLVADSGAVDSNYVQIWNMGTAGDTVIIDTVKFLSSLDTLAAPFSVGDSLGFPFMVDSLGRMLLPQPGDTLQLSVLFRPTAPGMFEDTLLITYSLGTDSGNHIDSIRIRGDSYIPAGQLYQSAPDTLYLMADTGMVGVNPVHIWNNGGGGDSIVVDTLRFVSTNDTLAAPFSISDSAGNAFASDSVGFVILPGGMLQLSGKFAPSVAGMFEDSLIIVYSFGKDSVNYTDTVHVSGMGTIPAGLEYASAPDTLFLAADSGAVDSNYVQIWNMGTAGDTVIIDTVKFLSSLDTLAAPFSVGDSLGFPFMVDSLGRMLLPQPGDTLQLSVLFRPTAPGMFEDTLLITYSLGTDSANHIDSITVRGQGTMPPPFAFYIEPPDSIIFPAVYSSDSLMAPAGIRNAAFGIDTLIIDSLRFISTSADTTAEFSVVDSFGVPFPVAINREIIYDGITDSLLFMVKFSPDTTGTFADTLLTYFHVNDTGSTHIDSLFVKGDGILAVPQFTSIPADSLFLPPTVKGEMDSVYFSVFNGGLGVLRIDSIRFASTYADTGLHFSIDHQVDSSLYDTTLAIPDTAFYMVYFTPQDIRTRTDSLVIYSNANNTVSSHFVLLRGRGILRFGDINMDGSITSMDASLILQQRVGIPSVVTYFASDTLLPMIADVTGNGEISAYDAAFILQKVLALRDSFPADDEQFLKTGRNVSGKASLVLDEMGAEAELISVLVRINDGKGIFAVDGRIEYDPNVLEFESMESRLDIGDGIKTAEAVNGELVFGIASGVPLTVDGDTLRFVFRRVDPSGKSTNIRLTELLFNEQNADVAISALEFASVPDRYYLNQNYPNPFNAETVIRFGLPEAQSVDIIIYNILGQKVKEIISGQFKAGNHRIRWDGRNEMGMPVSSGVYIYRMKAGRFIAVQKLLYLK